MCGSTKYPYPPHGWSLEILREGGGSQRSKFSKEIIKLNWNFQRGSGVPSKKPPMREVWIFSGTTCSEEGYDDLNNAHSRNLKRLTLTECCTPICTLNLHVRPLNGPVF